MLTPLFVTLFTLLLTLTCIDIGSIFLSKGTSLVVSASHALHITWDGLIGNHLLG